MVWALDLRHVRMPRYDNFDTIATGIDGQSLKIVKDIYRLIHDQPLACFAGLWTKGLRCERSKEGETTNDFLAFLTTGANTEVYDIHLQPMPVILTTPTERCVAGLALGGGHGTAVSPSDWIPQDCGKRHKGRVRMTA